MRSTVRIGNGQGFWGDSVDAPARLLRGGPIDYITMDYLAEVTMSIMQRQKVRNPERGYATDFVRFVDEVLPEITARNVRIIANAGGVICAAMEYQGASESAALASIEEKLRRNTHEVLSMAKRDGILITTRRYRFNRSLFELLRWVEIRKSLRKVYRSCFIC